MPDNFKKFVIKSDWHTTVLLDDKPLTTGEMLYVKFPDKSVHKLRVRVDTYRYQGRGGMDESYSNDTIWGEFVYHRVLAQINLGSADVTAERCNA